MEFARLGTRQSIIFLPFPLVFFHRNMNHDMGMGIKCGFISQVCLFSVRMSVLSMATIHIRFEQNEEFKTSDSLMMRLFYLYMHMKWWWSHPQNCNAIGNEQSGKKHTHRQKQKMQVDQEL